MNIIMVLITCLSVMLNFDQQILFHCYVLFQLNTTIHGTIKTTPYELVFGQLPWQYLFPRRAGNQILEDQIEGDIDPSSLANTDPSSIANTDTSTGQHRPIMD